MNVGFFLFSANDVMSGVTNKLTGHQPRPKSNGKKNDKAAVKKLKRNRKYLTLTKTYFLTTFFVTTTYLLHHATAEKYIGMNHHFLLLFFTH